LIYIPNSFTPDGDELNNVWLPIFTSGFDPFDFNIKVYNRWGENIWESNNHTEGWDGTYNNGLVQQGIYSWIATFSTPNNANKRVIMGNLNVIR
jgi:gliding motility-associated-like protein